MKQNPILLSAAFSLLAGLATASAAEVAIVAIPKPAMSAFAAVTTAAATIEQTWPGLASGALATATPGALPAGILLQADGDLKITALDLQAEIDQAPEAMRASLRENGLFVLEQLATRRLLLAEARQAQAGPVQKDEKLLISEHLQKLTAGAAVSEAEIAAFYEANKEMCGGAKLTDIKDSLNDYVLDEKRQKLVQEHIQRLGVSHHAVVAADWLKVQAETMRQNPVDQARVGGMPSLIDFGSKGCRPCDLLAPILDTLRAKYAGKMNVLFVNVRENPALAAQYGIEFIPVQVFFDKSGKEVFRHTGFWPQDELEKKAAEMGVQAP